jgi:hypothetical protein
MKCLLILALVAYVATAQTKPGVKEILFSFSLFCFFSSLLFFTSSVGLQQLCQGLEGISGKEDAV